jgi:hypothetical protein
MAKVRAYVYVYETTSSGVSYKVFPPVVILGKGDKLEVVNTVADFDALLTVPAGVFEGGEIKKKPVGKKKTFTTREAEAEEFTVVEYEVEVDGKKATGNSDPVIIIDP